MIALGIPVALLVMGWHSKRRGHHILSRHLPEAFLASAFAAFVGGKLGFILFYPNDFQQLLSSGGAKAALTQGFVYYGALIMQLPAAWIFFRWMRVPFSAGLDSFVVGIPVMHAFGRMGCFLAGCCYGCETDSAIGVTFHEGIGLNGVRIHPVQLYEAIGNVIILVLILFLSRKRPAAGTLTLAYFAFYALLRFITEGFRGDGNPTYTGENVSHQAGAPPRELTLAQWIALASFVVLISIVAVSWRRRPKKET
jgi:phosphatidylglycerol:prolipoprotein diacylglycerol transferase